MVWIPFRPFLSGARDIPASTWRARMRSALFSALLLAALLSGVDGPTTPHLTAALAGASDAGSLDSVLRPPSPVLLSGGFGEAGARGSQPAPHRVRRNRPHLEGAQVAKGPEPLLRGPRPATQRSPDLQPRPPPVSLRIA